MRGLIVLFVALRFFLYRGLSIKTHLGGGGTPTGTLKLRPEIRTNDVYKGHTKAGV